MSLAGRPRAVTFDATGTLFGVPRLADVYAEVLGRHGIAAPRDELRGLVPRVWQEFACSAEMGEDRFASHPEGARGWWRRFLGRLCEHLGAEPPSRFAAAELYARFARGDAYDLYPEVRRTLEELSAAGVPMAVISNWDERLRGVLHDLGLAGHFEAIVVSAEVGVEKPHPAIFERALAALGLPPEDVLHVGDRTREDVEGALAVGMEALLVVRGEAPDGRGDLTDLSRLPELVEGRDDDEPLTLPFG